MYAICREYPKEFDIRFNPAKFQLESFNSNASTSLVLENMHIHSTTTGIHVGDQIGINWQELSVRRICNDIHWRINSTISYFSYPDHTVKLSLFDSYCTAYYGVSLWNLERDISHFYITWRKSIRNILGVSGQTYIYLLPHFSRELPISMQIMLHLIHFVLRCLHSYNIVTIFE